MANCGCYERMDTAGCPRCWPRRRDRPVPAAQDAPVYVIARALSKRRNSKIIWGEDWSIANDIVLALKRHGFLVHESERLTGMEARAIVCEAPSSPAWDSAWEKLGRMASEGDG